jgi:hypothetical protein
MPQQNNRFNAFLDLGQAPVSHTQSGPLAGLTLAVKDIFDVAGYVTGCGNPDRTETGKPAPSTAPTVQRLVDAGARFVGKTQTDELAFSLMGQNAHYRRPRLREGSPTSALAPIPAAPSVHQPASAAWLACAPRMARSLCKAPCHWHPASTLSAGSPRISMCTRR